MANHRPDSGHGQTVGHRVTSVEIRQARDAHLTPAVALPSTADAAASTAVSVAAVAILGSKTGSALFENFTAEVAKVLVHPASQPARSLARLVPTVASE